MLRSLLLLLHALACAALPLLAGCSSTGASAVSGGARVILHGPQTTLRIASDSYLVAEGIEGETTSLRRAAFYSTKRADVLTKVAEDELVAGLIQALDGEGFARHAVEGTRAEGAPGSALEVQVGERSRTLAIRRGMSSEELETLKTCSAIFIDVYNRIEQYQAADPSQIRLEEPRR